MAIQTIPGGLWLPIAYPGSTAAPVISNTSTLSTANGRIAMVFQVPRTGTLDWFETRQALNSNTPDNGLRFSFQGVGSNGDPDNTEDEFAVVTAGFGGPAWLVPPGYMGATGTGSGAKRSVTRGEWLACVIRFESFVAADNVTFSVLAFPSTTADPSTLFKYNDFSSDGGVSYAKVANQGICIALRYDDGTYEPIGWPDNPMLTINTRTFNTGSTPDERGLLFQLPFPARIQGGWIRIDLDNPVDFILYDASDNIIASASYIAGQRLIGSGANGKFLFATPVNLDAGVNYRITALPTSASSIVTYDFDISAAALLGAIDGGVNWMSTNRSNAGAWTDVNTNRPFMGIILDGFDDAASGGGGEHSSVF